MGLGLYVHLDNNTLYELDVQVTISTCIFQDGEEGSHPERLQGVLSGSNKQYVERISSGLCASERAYIKLRFHYAGFFIYSTTILQGVGSGLGTNTGQEKNNERQRIQYSM